MSKLNNFQKAFFTLGAEKGITSSEGNNIANIIKELCLDITRRLAKIHPISEIVALETGKRALDEYKAQPLNEIRDLALQEGKLYALSAWIREAIKAKEEYMTRIKSCSMLEFLKEGEVMPEFNEDYPEVEMPVKPSQLTDKDIIGEFTIAERSEYYELEAMAAHIGKKIHEKDKGMFLMLRQKIDDYKPTLFRNLGIGTGYSVIECTLLYSREDAERIFFELQAHHRQYEQRLNGYKARINDQLNIRNAELEMRYKAEYTEAAEKKNQLGLDYRTRREAAEDKRAAMESWLEARRLETLNEAAGLKIRIPHGLQKIFEYIQEFQIINK